MGPGSCALQPLGADRRPAAAASRPSSPCCCTGTRLSLLCLPCCLACPADFNFTLPVMMGEFLLLMVFLDKFWFGPVGAVLDERDKSLRGKLALVKDNGAEVGAAAAGTC